MFERVKGWLGGSEKSISPSLSGASSAARGDNTVDEANRTRIGSEQADVNPLSQLFTPESSAKLNRLARAVLEDAIRDRLNLPSLPDIAIAIARKAEDPNTTVDDIVAMTQIDLSLTSKLIQVANSPVYAGLESVVTVRQAVTRMGLDTTRDIVVSTSLKSLFTSDSPKLRDRIKNLWAHSVKVASICSILSRETGVSDPETALVAGLIHDVGALAVIQYAAHPNGQVPYSEQEIDDAIHVLRGPLGEILVRSWHLHGEMITAVRFAKDFTYEHQHDPTLIDLILVSHIHALAGTPEMADLPPLEDIPAIARLDLETLGPEEGISVLSESRQEIEAIRSALVG